MLTKNHFHIYQIDNLIISRYPVFRGAELTILITAGM